MRNVEVEGKGKYGSYTGTIVQFEKLEEYRDWLRDTRGSKDVHADVLKAINDYENRTQRQALRPGPAKATGVRKYSTAISEALKSGDVDDETLANALAAAGVKIDISEAAAEAEEEEEEEGEEEG